MTARTLDETAAAPAALTAFLRGVERRGAVFAQLLTGSAAAGDEALVATLRAFRALVGDTPFTDWPRRFWSLLLASPRLRTSPWDPAWPPAFAVLPGLGRGPRAALLLRLVAGLADADAAAVLGVARPTYRLALLRALPHREDGAPDAERWKSLAEAAQAAIRQLPADRLAEIARHREAAVHGLKPPPAPRPRRVAHGGDRSWRLARLAVVAATGLALAVTWLWPDFLRESAPDGIRVEPLPPPQPPKAMYHDDARLLTHRDFDMLLADTGTPASGDPGFYAWYAVQVERSRAGDDAEPLPLGDADEPLADLPGTDAGPTEVDDAPR
ncbi:hypothetical protein [Luteimonas vadosa]|uniref:RNA polymerase subunit sigma-70 n=1 Tax=Luteimonas vadosa TaxID=1165507 RepID=A0ABP9DRI4_9GAMM